MTNPNHIAAIGSNHTRSVESATAAACRWIEIAYQTTNYKPKDGRPECTPDRAVSPVRPFWIAFSSLIKQAVGTEADSSA